MSSMRSYEIVLQHFISQQTTLKPNSTHYVPTAKSGGNVRLLIHAIFNHEAQVSSSSAVMPLHSIQLYLNEGEINLHPWVWETSIKFWHLRR
jgi:hypothetical protein